MNENIQSIANGSFVLGQTSSENPSLLVNENTEGNVSILQGTVATSAGIVGDGSPQNPLRVDSEYIVVTEEPVGTYSVGSADVNISGEFSKTGYTPIAWTYRYGNAGSINFNQEETYINNGTLYFQGYAKRASGSGSYNMSLSIIITWLKV